VDGRSDLFSAGILLYQMLSGHAPFQGDSVVSLAMKIANEEPVPLDKLRPDIPQAVRRIVERCLAKAPERRFQTGKELADALSRALFNLDEEAREQGRPRIVPLRVKWALTMGLIVFAVMAVTGAIVNRLQGAALMDQVTDYGAALSRFIAAQNAVTALSEEWDAVDVALQEIMKTRDFKSVTVVDHGGVVRASSEASQLGQPYQPRSGERLDGREGGVNVTRYVDQKDSILGFEAPMTFQGKTIGRIALGIPEAPLTRVARLSLSLMAALVVVTVLAVAVAMYFLANWFARPIKILSESMIEITQGRFEHRIREQRKDEFGALFRAFDEMAQALQSRFIPGPGVAAGAAPTAVEPKPPKAAPLPATAADSAKRPAAGPPPGPEVAAKAAD
jgi:eukaryotic-like serine/threonine-protein kinase